MPGSKNHLCVFPKKIVHDRFETASTINLKCRPRWLKYALGRITRFNVDIFTPVIILHRRAITYKNFDSGTFNSCDPGSELLMDISAATYDFEDEIERQYRESYPSRFPYFKIFSCCWDVA